MPASSVPRPCWVNQVGCTVVRDFCCFSDQWSPSNPSGKKQYDRGFLLQLQYANECLGKPDGLPELPEVILDKVSAQTYRQVSNIRRTLVGDKIVDHADVVRASPVGAAPATSSFST